MNPTIDLLQSHRSIRKFSDRRVDNGTLETIIAAAQCAATSHFVQAYDRTTNHYFLNRDRNLKDETWSRQMADLMGRVIRPHMKSFLERKGFLLK